MSVDRVQNRPANDFISKKFLCAFSVDTEVHMHDRIRADEVNFVSLDPLSFNDLGWHNACEIIAACFDLRSGAYLSLE